MKDTPEFGAMAAALGECREEVEVPDRRFLENRVTLFHSVRDYSSA
ncbi:unnamed protein product [Soboliphyme baturini]|uniref:Methyltransferase n=1 Tax=Soboliphyme baturini TaxID=241478 RepID=A0A183IYU4_9BILA|nr:unnamed protein product [Soboliphyme baturini]